MKNLENKRQGFIKLIIILIVVIIVLGYFGFDLKRIMEGETVQGNLSYAWNFVVYVWDHFLKAPAVWVWNVIVVGIFWDLVLQPALETLRNAKN